MTSAACSVQPHRASAERAPQRAGSSVWSEDRTPTIHGWSEVCRVERAGRHGNTGPIWCAAPTVRTRRSNTRTWPTSPVASCRIEAIRAIRAGSSFAGGAGAADDPLGAARACSCRVGAGQGTRPARLLARWAVAVRCTSSARAGRCPRPRASERPGDWRALRGHSAGAYLFDGGLLIDLSGVFRPPP